MAVSLKMPDAKINHAALVRFIEDEIERRKRKAKLQQLAGERVDSFSERKFAEEMGTTHTTLLRVKRGQPPTLDFLIKLSLYTETDIRALMAMLAPQATRRGVNDETASALASRIARLPAEVQNAIDALLSQFWREHGNDGE